MQQSSTDGGAPFDDVLIIDPIFRGSRLYYTELASRVGQRVTVLTRTNALTQASENAFAGRSIDIREVVQTPPDSWYAFLDSRQGSQLCDALGTYLRETKPDLLFCAGMDELGVQFVRCLAKHAESLAGGRIVGIYYTPTFQLSLRFGERRLKLPFTEGQPQGQFGRTVRPLRRLKKRALPKLCIGLLDETAADKLAHDPLFTLFPDPPPPPPVPGSEELGRDVASVLDDNRNGPRLLLVGRQSARKGFGDIRRLLECHADALPKDAQFVLSGQLEPELEKERAFIRAQSERITHIDRYLNECEIRALYEASDYVLLPYTTDFSGSSGVLATAAATGKPVITTNHGVVGMRTTTYGLGYTYPSGNAAALAAILATLPDTKSFEYAALRDRGLQFAELNSVNAFCARLVNQD